MVPLSSSFFAGRLLNCLHHEVKSRRDEAGSGVATGAGWGSPLRTRGVWGLVCVPAGAMAGSMVVSVAARRLCWRKSCGERSCPGTGGPQVGRRQLSGGRRYVTSEGRSVGSEGAMVASVHEVSAGPLSYCCGGDGGMVDRSDRARALSTRRAVRGTDAACRRQAQGCRPSGQGLVGRNIFSARLKLWLEAT